MNELFSNLFVLVPLAIFIALRILQARAQQRQNLQARQKPVTRDKNREKEERVARRKKQERLFFPFGQEVFIPVEPMPATEEGPEEVSRKETTTYTPPPVQSVEEPKQSIPLFTPVQRRKKPSIPPQVTRLSPWKQAVVLRELLGPPKGW
ncbi:MAG: hypothetical protein SNJ78_01755 [Spirochaetales bacterium]